MFSINVAPMLQLVRLKPFNRVSKVTDNINNYFTTSRILFHTIHNDYSTYCKSNEQDLILNNQQQSMISMKSVIKQVDSRILNNYLHTPRPAIISGAILYNKRSHMGYKINCCNQYYNNIRHLSTGNIDPIAENTIPMQYNGIFKMLSESMPVKIAQDSLLWIHDCTNLPWWLVIVLTTVAMRTTITLPLSLYQHYILAKLENLKHEMDEIIKELKIETRYGIHKYNWSEKHARYLYNYSVSKQWNKLIIRENCHPAKTSVLALVQLPLWVSLSMSIRNLCYMLPKQDASAYNIYQEFTNGGFLWITNLTVVDPVILPIAMGLFNLIIIEINYMSRLQEQIKWRKYLTHFFRIVTVCLIPIAMYVPSCVSLYWATSSAFGIFQNLLLLSPKIRRFAGVPITPTESQNPYMMLRERIIARCRFKKRIDVSSKI